MKKNKIVLTAFLVSIMFTLSFFNLIYANLNLDSEEKEVLITKHIRVVTKGLVCSFCAQGIKKGLESHSAIISVVFNKDYNLVDIHFKESNLISKEEIVKIFNDSGYEVDKIINNPKQ